MILRWSTPSFAILAALLAAGCSSQATNTSSTATAQANNAQTENSQAENTQANNTQASPDVIKPEVQKKLLAAKDALFTKLSGKLMQTMAEQGPVAAIAVCNQEAPKIAATVSEEHNVQIGRIGVRLRNPKNAAPQWAEEWVAAKTDTPKFLTLADGKQAALLPIKLQATCLMCHGPKEQIAAEVLSELAKLYPEDQATGFHEGELRGWFWIVANDARQDNFP